MAPPVRIAFSGLGDHAQRAHLKHLVRSQSCKVVGAFDPALRTAGHPESLQAHGLDLSFKRYRSFDELVADSEVDAVLIASPDRFHLPQAQQAVQAGKHVLCEKPLCADRQELPALRAMLSDAGGKGLVVTSCHPRRFDPPYVWLSGCLPQLIQKYGAVLQMSLDFSYHEPGAAKSALHDGSLLLDHANHEIDCVNFLLGPSAVSLTRLADGLDRYALSGARDDGVTLHFHGTRRLTGRIYPERIHVRFERGELDLNTYDSRLSRIVDHEEVVHQTDGIATPDSGLHPVDHPVTDYDARFRDVNEVWIDSILHGRPGYLTPEDMLGNAAISVGFGAGGSGTLRLGQDGLEQC
jgi:predicted dehydrogenase